MELGALPADLSPRMPTTAPLQSLRDLPPGAPVQLVAFDLDGVPRGKLLTRDKALAALREGFGFCDVVFGWDIADAPYDGAGLVGWGAGYPDARATVDAATLRQTPWADGRPLLIADFSGGHLADACPRSLLRRVSAQAADLGYGIRAGFEYEWFNFRETPDSLAAKRGAPPTPITPGMHGYSVLRPAAEPAFHQALWTDLAAFGTPLEGLHTETGPGVYEAALPPAAALPAADAAALMKLAVKQVARRHGFTASFMAKWRDDLPGCGGHLHQSLWSADGTAALGFDESRPHGMSQACEHYLAGVLHALPRLAPLWAPNVNSYKRLVPGSWAATSVSWGVDNRTAAVRIVGGGPASYRLELRLPGADANPYLALAASVAAGLYGIRKELPLSLKPVTGDAYEATGLTPLPRDLGESVRAMREAHDFAAELLGEAFVGHFLRTREWELRQARAAVTDWERRRYLELA